ncbi:MAG: S8 family serine peptidase [Hyphomonadaceae bacterium]
MSRIVAAIVVALALASAQAAAQLSLPQVNVPGVPSVGDALGQLPEAEQALDPALLRDVRQLRIRELLRTHRRQLEADPDGQPIIRSQILALAPSEAALAAARAAGFTIVSTEQLGAFGAMVVLRAPPNLSTRRALRLLREADPDGVFDFDHLHIESGGSEPASAAAGANGGGDGVRVGLIDSGVDAGTAVAAQRGFSGGQAVAGAHGAIVSSLILSTAPHARLYVADIYGGSPVGGTSSAMARGLAWLAAERVPVINVSLVGPRNRIVETAVEHLVDDGFLIVAAVGNDGPAAPPLYPAAYDGVIGVTGVDRRGRVLVEAGRGPQVDFAALGLAGRVRGTSYAAPIVAGMLANHAGDPSSPNAARAVGALSRQARDLGARGRDDVYGAGLVAPADSVAAR